MLPKRRRNHHQWLKKCCTHQRKSSSFDLAALKSMNLLSNPYLSVRRVQLEKFINEDENSLTWNQDSGWSEWKIHHFLYVSIWHVVYALSWESHFAFFVLSSCSFIMSERMWWKYEYPLSTTTLKRSKLETIVFRRSVSLLCWFNSFAWLSNRISRAESEEGGKHFELAGKSSRKTGTLSEWTCNNISAERDA